MSVQRLVARARAAAEQLMVDTCRIRAEVGETTDPATGKVTPVYGPAVYEGRCKLQQQRGSLPSNPDAGEHRWTVSPLELHLPVVGSGGVKAGMVVEMLTSFDPTNAGRVFRVRSGDRKTFQSAMRFAVEEVVG